MIALGPRQCFQPVAKECNTHTSVWERGGCVLRIGRDAKSCHPCKACVAGLLDFSLAVGNKEAQAPVLARAWITPVLAANLPAVVPISGQNS